MEIGGEVRARGTKLKNSSWRVGIEAPLVDQRKVKWAVEIGDRAMATSGDYRNFFEHKGKHYSHTIDPRTGRPVAHALASVSVISDSCMEADALATMLMVLGPEKGFEFASAGNSPALLIVRHSDEFKEKATTQFPPLLDVTKLSGKGSNPSGAGSSGSNTAIFLAALLVFGLAVAGMAIGVILSNRRLKGTCGGLSSMGDSAGGPLCQFCTNPSPECIGPESKDPSDLKQPESASRESVL